MRRTVPRTDAGLTMIEMLLVVMILGVIALPLTTVLIGIITIPAESQQRVADTSDAQLLAAYFENDVQSTDTVDTTGCSASGVALALHWTDVTAPATLSSPETTVTKTVVYQVSAASATMTRTYCDSTGVTDTQTILSSLDTANPPVFVCDGVACPGTGSPRTITVTATETPSLHDTANYTFSLSATRRNS